MSKRFPVLRSRWDEQGSKPNVEYPKSVPWELVQDHQTQAQTNHSQTLERLAERGGLSPKELWCVVHDQKYEEAGTMTGALAIEWLKTLPDVEWQNDKL